MEKVTHMKVFGSTPRIQRLRNQYVNTRVDVCLDRAVSYTRTYQATGAEPMMLRRAEAFKAYCESKPIRIEEGELLVASAGDRPRVAVICPETKLRVESETNAPVVSRTVEATG